MAEARLYENNNIPVRPQASPRLSPPPFPVSLASFDSVCGIDGSGDDLFKRSSRTRHPRRGRTLHRIPAQSRLVSRATERIRPEFDAASQQRRARRSPYSVRKTPKELDHSLLEPLPLERLRLSLSEELCRAIASDNSTDVARFASHRDALAVLGLRQFQHGRPAPSQMASAHIALYPDFETYEDEHLTCHSWSMAISAVRPIEIPPAMTLPAEILERIYFELSPLDFNATRHTCRAWMMTSLEETLLLLMAKRGGWSNAILADKEVKAGQDLQYRMTAISDKWLLGKRLATECSLSPGWSGSGVVNVPMTTTGLRLTSEIDFLQLNTAPSRSVNNRLPQSTHFAVSECSRFLLAFHSCTVYVYALRGSLGVGLIQPYGGHLEPWSTIHCPAHVLTVSMDTSSGRFTVAALLHGSIGIVCDIGPKGASTPQLSLKYVQGSAATNDGVQIPVLTLCFPDEPISMDATAHSYTTLRTVCGTMTDHFHACQLPSTRRRVYHTSSPSNGRIGDGFWTVYRNLCCFDDPPRSVAICPQRNCVAFGCRTGVELHWVDALTGQNLIRWISRSAPSDFVSFMPSRRFKDCKEKLRLISSTMPDNASTKTQGNHLGQKIRTESTVHCDNRQSSYDNRDSKPVPYPGYCRAMPLSDGCHVLFMLPGSRGLYLGREDPADPTFGKLVKKVTFVGPKDEHGIIMLPCLYAAATEMRWGLRVAVAYSDQLWLFVVPPDLLFENGIRPKTHYASTATQYDPTTPVPIAGENLATILGLESLALDASTGDLTIWAFSQSARAYVFQLAGRNMRSVTQRAALSDGTIVLKQDIDGDTIMTEAPYIPEDAAQQSNGTTYQQGSYSSLIPCPATGHHRYCNFLVDTESHAFIESNEPPFPPSYTQLSKDEGYASADDDQFDMAGGRFAFNIPSVSGHQREDDLDWVSGYLTESGTRTEDEGMGLDVMDMCRCECEIIGA